MQKFVPFPIIFSTSRNVSDTDLKQFSKSY